MNTQERLNYCELCKYKKASSQGLICTLNNKSAVLEGICFPELEDSDTSTDVSIKPYELAPKSSFIHFITNTIFYFTFSIVMYASVLVTLGIIIFGALF